MKKFSGKLSIPEKKEGSRARPVPREEARVQPEPWQAEAQEAAAWEEPEEAGEEFEPDQRPSAKPWVHKRALDKIREKNVRAVFTTTVLVMLVVGAISGAFFLGHWDAARRLAKAEKEALEEKGEPDAQALALIDSGLAAEFSGQLSQAFEELKAAADRDRSLYGIDYLVARAAFKSGNRSDAARYAEAAISKNQRAGDAYVLLGLMAWTAKRANEQRMIPAGDEAMIHLERAIAADPGNPMPFYFSGDILREMGKTDQGLDMLRKAEHRMDAADSFLAVRAKRMLAEAQLGQRTRGEPAGIGEMIVEGYLAAADGEHDQARKWLDEARRFASRPTFRLLTADVAFRDLIPDKALLSSPDAAAPIEKATSGGVPFRDSPPPGAAPTASGQVP